MVWVGPSLRSCLAHSSCHSIKLWFIHLPPTLSILPHLLSTHTPLMLSNFLFQHAYRVTQLMHTCVSLRDSGRRWIRKVPALLLLKVLKVSLTEMTASLTPPHSTLYWGRFLQHHLKNSISCQERRSCGISSLMVYVLKDFYPNDVKGRRKCPICSTYKIDFEEMDTQVQSGHFREATLKVAVQTLILLVWNTP